MAVHNFYDNTDTSIRICITFYPSLKIVAEKFVSGCCLQRLLISIVFKHNRQTVKVLTLNHIKWTKRKFRYIVEAGWAMENWTRGNKL